MRNLLAKIREHFQGVPPVKTYVIWNPEKISPYTHLPLTTTYGGLRECERKSGYSWSSVVCTTDIEGLINAIHNESDVCLCYKEIR